MTASTSGRAIIAQALLLRAAVAVLALTWVCATAAKAVEIDYGEHFHWCGGVKPVGHEEAVAVSGRYAALAEYQDGLAIVDVLDSTRPTVVSSLPFEGWITDVAIAGHYVYAVGVGVGLVIVDIADPAEPVIVANIPVSATAVALYGAYAYVANGSPGLTVIDVSNPSAPRVVGAAVISGGATDVDVFGGYACVSDGQGALKVVSVSNPAAPVIVGSVSLPQMAWGVAVRPGRVYVADHSSGVLIYSLADPAHPTLLGTVAVASPAFNVTLDGSRAFIGCGDGVICADVTNPQSPTTLAYLQSGDVDGVVVQGNRAYVAVWGEGLVIADITSLIAAPMLGSVDTYFSPRAGDSIGNTAYMCDDHSIYAVDLSQPQNPVLQGRVWGLSGVSCLAVHNTISGPRVVSERGVFDFTDPWHPHFEGLFPDVAGDWVDIDIDGETAYVTGLTAVPGLWLFNASTGELLGSVSVGPAPSRLAIRGGLAFVITSSPAGVTIVDVADPHAPFIRGSLTFGGVLTDVATVGDVLFVADNYSALHLVDVHDPSAPVLVKSFFLPPTGKVATVGECVYIATTCGVQVLNAADPLNPAWIGTICDARGPVVPTTGVLAVWSGDTSIGSVPYQRQLPIANVTSEQRARTRLDVHPNPMSASTRIVFSSGERSRALNIYDVRGGLVRALPGGSRAASGETLEWDGRDDRGTPVASGTYFLREIHSRAAPCRVVVIR